jgi:ribosomal protein S18 acetylase RimI-like enzyme
LVAGFVRLGVEGDDPPLGMIYLLYLMPQHQRRGLGSAFMNAAMMDLRELGAREAALCVLRDNHPARAFYEKHGWQPDGRTSTENYGGVALEALCYRRRVP